MEDHIHIYGMSSSYTRWVHHGEPLIDEDYEDREHENQTLDHIEHDTHDGFGVKEEEDDDDD